jgi:formate hydrogenlyase transcriptional activator
MSSELGNQTDASGDGAATLQAAQFESLVAELSKALVMTPTHLIDDRIGEWLQRATEFLGCEGSSVSQFAWDGLSGLVTHTWMAPGLPPPPKSMGNADWPWVFQRLKEGESVVFCSPDELPPEAQVDIQTYHKLGVMSCVSVPLACDGITVGAFGMGTVTRRHTWSDAITQRIRLVGELLGGALARKRVQEELEQQLRFEVMIAELSATLMAASFETVHDAIVAGLRRLAEFLCVDRCSIFESSKDAAFLKLAHVWAAPGVPVVSEVELDRQFPWMAEIVRRGEMLALPNADAIPADASQDRRSWETADRKSVLFVPALIGGTPRYVLALTCTQSARRWPDRLIPRMQIVGSIFADAMERMRADLEIQRHVNCLAEAQRIAHLGNWEWDLVKDRLKWSDEVYRIFGVNPRQFNPSMDAFWTFVHPDDLATVQQEAQRATEGPSGIYSVDHRIVRHDGSCRVVRELATPSFERDGRAARLAGTVQDITEIHTAYEEIRRLKDQLEAENIYLREELSSVTGYGAIVGTADAIRRVITQAQQVAPTDSTVLILGETGTGKELLAHFIHGRSLRKSRPFITTNLAAIPATIIESELFGREKGAFTGALTRQIGRFEAADGGTILLDEIGEMPAETQAKLLRVLQSGEFERLGSSKTMRVNVRVIAATNRDLAAAVGAGTFRQDLYYRLNVFPITVPPLRDRREDIPQLAWAFIKEFGEKMGKPIDHIKRTSMAALQAHPWPGNIRELRNVIERSMILTQGQELSVSLPGAAGLSQNAGAEMREVERRHIRHILEATGGRIRGKGGAAELLGLKPSTLYFRMKKLDVRRDA